jgi:hypothetical protein
MKSKKRLLIGGLIAALVVLAVPALALAAVWKDKGVNVNKFVEIGLTGGELFETSEGNGMNCKITATLTTEGGSTGTITEFATPECPSGFGSFASCELNTSSAKGLPWDVHVNATDLTITNWRQKRTFKAGCPTSEFDKTIGSLTVTLDEPTAITEMEFLGETSGYKIKAGSFTVNAPNSGTYGIG